MPITLTYAEQATGIVLGADGNRGLDALEAYSEKAADLPEAIEKIEAYLERIPDSEAWINYREHSYRTTIPGSGGFGDWITRYSETGDTEPIVIGMDLGAVISEIGIPAQVGHGLGHRGLGAIFRYSPGSVDFHFDADGTLFLVHDDDLDSPRTILTEAEQDAAPNR